MKKIYSLGKLLRNQSGAQLGVDCICVSFSVCALGIDQLKTSPWTSGRFTSAAASSAYSSYGTSEDGNPLFLHNKA